MGGPIVSTCKTRELVDRVNNATGYYGELATPDDTLRISSKCVESVPRETEGKEKGIGCLSILIVLFESREIRTAESRGVGKGDAGS